jgi:hypothetical protein
MGMGAPLKPTISVNLGWNKTTILGQDNMMGPNEQSPTPANGLENFSAKKKIPKDDNSSHEGPYISLNMRKPEEKSKRKNTRKDR